MADIEKRGYKVYANWLNWIELLSKDQIAEWTLWIFNYMNKNVLEIPNNDQALAMAINMAKNVIDVDMAFYNAKEEAGKKGGITTQLKQKKAKPSTLKQNQAETSTNKQVEADMIRKDKIRQDMTSNDMVCNDISLKEDEEKNIDNLISFKDSLGVLLGRNLTHAENIIINNFKKTMSEESIYNDIKFYKERGKTDPINYMDRVIQNANIQKKVFKEEVIEQPSSNYPSHISNTTEALKYVYDSDAPQYLQDEAKAWMDRHNN